MNLMRKGLLVLLLFSNLVSASNKPIIRIVSPEISGFANTDGTGTYWEIIKSTLGKNYQLQLSTASLSQISKLNDEGFADVIITPENALPLEGVIYSKNYIDTRYPVYFHYDQSQQTKTTDLTLEGKTIGISKALYKLALLPNSTKTYQVDSVNNLARLVINGRLDGILTNSYNVHFADPEKHLVTTQWQPEQRVLLAFKDNTVGQKLADEFDLLMTQLIASDHLASLFDKEADYLHAGFNTQPLSTSFSWHLIPKRYSTDSKKLETLDFEVVASEYIAERISGVNLDMKVNSSRVVLDAMTRLENHCVLNLMKTPEREEIAYFSKPSYVFLPPRLFMLKDAELFKQIAHLDLHEIDLPAFTKQFKQARIAITKSGNTERTLSKAYGDGILEELYLVDDQSLRSVLSLLLSRRVDAVVTWSAHIPSLIKDKQVASHLASFALTPINKTVSYSHVACTKSALGKSIIEQINELLAQPTHQMSLFQHLISEMDASSAQEFKARLNLSF